MSTFYAIKHIPSGMYLPFSKTKNETAAELSSTEPPRLFRLKSHAQCCLTHWLRGKTYGKWYEETWATQGDYNLYTEKISSRTENEMTIVEVSIEVLK